jgi:hypothetical protein
MTEWNKVLIPMVRQAMPSLIAQQIVGVQPMNISTDETPLETGETYIDEATSYATEANTVEFYWAKPKEQSISIFNFRNLTSNLDLDIEIFTWAHDTFGAPSDPATTVERWFRSNKKYYFTDAEDRLVFVMRWS